MGKITDTKVFDAIEMNDLISRQALYEILDEYDEGKIYWGEAEDRIGNLPSAQPDLSGYSDRLWKRAYDRGYEQCRQEAIELVHSLYPSAPIVRMNRERWKEKYKSYIEVEKMLEMLPSAQPDDFLEFLWNVINPNEMQRYLEMYWSGEEKTNG